MVPFGKELVVEKNMPRSSGTASRMLEAVCIEALGFGSFMLSLETDAFKRNLFTVLKNAHLIFLS